VKRILTVLTVALVMVAIIVVTAAPSFAINDRFTTTTKNKQGHETSGNCSAQPQKCETRNPANKVVPAFSE
jgi:hypothetical protein